MKKLFYLLSMLFLFLAVSPMAMAKKDNPELTEEEKTG